MKANMINTNSIKTYLCAVVMLLGMSANAWGALTFTATPSSKDIEISEATDSYFDVEISVSGTLQQLTDDEGNKYYINAILGDWGDNEDYTLECSFDTESVTYIKNDNSGTLRVWYTIMSQGTYSFDIYIYAQEKGQAMTYTTVPVTITWDCNEPTLTLGSSTTTMNFGDNSNTFTVTKTTNSTGTITWSSTDESVATVAQNGSGNGVVTVVGAGTATIQCKVDAAGGKCAKTVGHSLTVNAVTPVLATNVSGKEFAVSAETAHGATFSGGVVTSKGNASITRYGFVIGTSSTVVVGGTGANKPVIGTYWSDDIALNTAFGSKTATTGLTAGTTYYARPWAYNGELYGYGTAVSFTTLNEYDIDLDKNNSDDGSTDGLATVAENATSIEIEAPTRTGYHVEGYYTTSGCATKVATAAGALQASITVSETNWTNGSSQWVKGGDATFYTNWAANTYTVTFDKNGGSGGSDNVTATYNAAMPVATMPTTPPAVGKVFEGYYYNSVKYYNADGSSAHVWDVAGAATLTAAWTTSSPTLTIASVDKIVISSTTPSLSEAGSASVTYNSTVTLSHGDPDAGYYWLDWNVYETGNEGNTLTVTNNQFTMPNHDVTVSANLYTDLVFSCSELTLTPHLVTASTPIFITSTANKQVRSQDYIQITGSGLTPNSDLSFPNLNSKFAVLTASGGTLSTDEDGSIDEAAYIFYTPAADATTDGIDEMSGLTVSVGGAKPKQASLVQSIIGRHLPAAFVIAGKKNNKWYAMPANMASTMNPKPSEIAVDNLSNPSVAYAADSTIYSMEGPTASNISGSNGQYIRFVMMPLWADDSDHSKGHAPLFGSATGTRTIGKSGDSQATSNLNSGGWWWKLVQTNTSITNPQDAKYTIYAANNSSSLSLRDNAGNPDWGLFASGVSELRLIPASSIASAVASVVEWGQHSAVIEVDAEGIGATSVVGYLGEATSSPITLVQTKAGDPKNAKSKYNYTVPFGDGIDFAAAASNGAMLTLEWKNGETVKAMSNIIVPKIIASTGDMKTIMSGDAQWETEVHVLPGVTLTANGGSFESSDVKINLLEIYPGATVSVTTGTLNVASLVLRNGWRRIGGKTYDVARLHVATAANLTKANITDGWYSDWYIDYDQYYPIAVPFPVATSSICYKNSNSAASSGVTIRYYDGALRATNEQQYQDLNWVAYTWGGTMPANLEPSKGYVMTAKRPSGKAFSIVRLPMTFSNPWTASGEKGEVGGTHKDQVEITAYGADADPAKPTYVVGWNMIANPYMAVYTGTIEYGDETKVNVVNIPDVDFREYDQVATATAKLKPGSAFLVQAPKTGVVTFGAANRQLSMPSYRREVREETEPEQQAYIVLSNEEAEDMMGIFVSDKYTAEYDLNGDVEKMLSDGTTLRTYMRYNDMNMAYVAIDKVLAQEPIPVSVRIPNDGEYTFSLHEASIVANLEGIYLIDHYEGNRETNLLEENYMFYSPAGTIADRFTINAKVGARDVPTDIDVTEAEKNSGKAVKFLYRDKLYIMRSGRIYDATGKQVKGGAQ